MKRQLFTLFVVLFLAAFGSASRVRQANAAETVATVPSDVSARMNEVLAQAHKTWRKDAIVTQVDLQWYPQQLPTAQFGLVMRLYSPSNRMERTVTLGGPQDGSVLDLGRNLNDNSPTRPIPDFKIDLPDAFVAASRAGVSGIMFSVRLAMIGAKGTPPILAWQFQPVEFRPYPLPIDAQTGAVIPWQRVYDPPQWTDEQMRQAWDRVLHRNQPVAGGQGVAPWLQPNPPSYCLAGGSC